MGTLQNKGQKSRVESYELPVTNKEGTNLLISGDAKIEAGVLRGIENGRVLDESQRTDGVLPITPFVIWYRTTDGRVVVTSSAELGQVEIAAPYIREFVEAVKAEIAAAAAAMAAPARIEDEPTEQEGGAR
ncbi:MAG: hypothetical protein LIO68_04305 [Rikenellaceae bacterium]|nr:hypothetical protein [Rikenellaceae bacterium]